MSPPRTRLGRGLGALLGEHLEPVPEEGEVRRVRVDSVKPNRHQPRQDFSDQELDELAQSIKENGLLQPLVVRPEPRAADSFELVAGERRLRAVRRLGWDHVPAVVRDVPDATMLVLALVENLQRQSLNPLEEADGYRELSESFGMTQAEIASAVGKSRPAITNALRLLRLPASVRQLVRSDELSMGHARALVAVDDPLLAAELARKAVREGWSVREIERRASSEKRGKAAGRRAEPAGAADPTQLALEEALGAHLSTRVGVRGISGRKGVIEVRFAGPDEFERLFELIVGREVSDVLS